MKHKKAIISAVAALVIGAAAIGAAVMSKNSPQPPAETTPMTSPAETPSETTTIDFSNAEEVIIGLSDTQLTDELKTQLADINAALENYMSSHKKDKDLLTEYGFLYSDTAGTNVTVKDLVKQGVIQADEETAEYTDDRASGRRACGHDLRAAV